ncbi:hypothetical protein GALMADRAFT_1301839 [Galerina marginata CBS 339.88]|uniref:Fe2OG dioxygenase domain-containing protein n=1 Tax=Galerina marginata (strain CBS 339.88) TaxID=685588 RepID=A0A067T4J7_GALM3|nr:hypothetical protein GALMADRAFT_1301839 [Galerina marginata CBS 339.88]
MSSPTTSLDVFKAAFENISELPYCSGTVPLDASTATLFYRAGNKAELLNFANATETQLSSLAEACQQATFGVNQKDVLDESYRKAGKLDSTEFATQFSPLSSGIVDTIRESLLQGEHAEKSIKVELYKLNVYGPGSFFKAHVDTPRSDTMFGSLVVVLPTAHEGGSLIFRHRGQERTFDTAHAVVSQDKPQVAFVAFFSDVEHEVSVVTSGYRVTLTYNLYFIDDPSSAPEASLGVVSDQDPLDQLKAALTALLSDPEFLPEGGLLGFGLSHKYPFNPSTTRLSQLVKRLKGSDADTRRICKALSLDVSLRAIYHGIYDGNSCLLGNFAVLGDQEIEDNVIYHINDQGRGTYVYEFGQYSEQDEALPIVWVKPLSKFNSFQQTYLAFGNEATLGYVYGEVCLVAEILTPEERYSE